ncbi:hypothetical protein [Nonomuraea sp. NPDC002799]
MKSAWSCHPATIAGAILLLVNDHLLKQVWPGFLTGKLSDVAGLVVAPALLALLFWRRADLAAILLTGALFTLVKTTETGAEIASHAWTLVAGPSRVLADPTDLLALPALALAWWVRRRSLHERSPRWRIIATMPLAVLAVTATAAAPAPPYADAVEVNESGGRITVHSADVTAWSSEDGGRTWSRGGDHEGQVIRSAQCVPWQVARCYRVTDGRLGVEQSDDGGTTWEPSWAPSADDLRRLGRRYEDQAALRSVALAVQKQPDGHIVVVANGLDGILIRDPSGTWRRVGWPGEDPAEAVDVSPELNVALGLAACLLFGSIGAGLRRHQRAYLWFAGVGSGGVYLILLGWDRLWADGPQLLLLGGLMTVVGVVVCLALMFAGRARPAPVAVGILGAPVLFAGVFTPFYGWSMGVPGPYWLAVALAALMAVLVVGASAALIRRDARHAHTYLFDGSSTSSPT